MTGWITPTGAPDPDALYVGEHVVDVTGNTGSTTAGLAVVDMTSAFPDVEDGFQGRIDLSLTIVGSNTSGTAGRAFVRRQLTAAYTTGGGWSFASSAGDQGDDGGLTSISIYFSDPPRLRAAGGVSTIRATGWIRLYGTATVPAWDPP